LQAEHERYLAEHHIGGPLFVTNYPAAIKPFYMRVDDAPAAPAPGVAVATPEDLRTVACVDLLVPGMGELCGGSQREERYHVLLQRMHESGMKTADYTWYADLRRFGSVPHAGWGMGFERFVAFATGMENVRDTTLVPRAAGLMQL
jgi:asparaginyl-tRNA synthetase